MMLSDRNGFTLIELLIVLIIIGVLATLAIPQYTDYVERARAAEALNMLNALKTGQAAYKLEAGSYTNTLASLGITNIHADNTAAVDAGQHWYYTGADAAATQYKITAARSSKNAGTSKDKTIIMTWEDAKGVVWSGNHPGVPK